MLTGSDLNQESGSQPSPHMVALEDPKRTRDRTQADMVVGKNTVTVEGAQKPASGQKEQAFTTEPMKTRRSQLAEESKMNIAAQAVPTPEVARGTDLALVGTLHEKELKKEVKQEKRERPVDNIIPAETRAGLKEELASVHKSAEQTTEVSMETATHSEPLKRAAFSELEGEVTPEKRPRLSSVSSVSSISSVSPPASSTSSPSTPVLATNPRVPPLKVWCLFRSASPHPYQNMPAACFEGPSNKLGIFVFAVAFKGVRGSEGVTDNENNCYYFSLSVNLQNKYMN